MLELHIFNKKSKANSNLVSWDEPTKTSVKNFTLEITSGKLKSKELHPVLVKDLAEFYKANPQISQLFTGDEAYIVKAQLMQGAHHSVFYMLETGVLHLDANIQKEFFPIYFFGFYYAALRKYKSQDQLYLNLFSFFENLSQPDFDALINFMRQDDRVTRKYDAGGHLLSFLEKVSAVRAETLELSSEEKYTLVQLFRNRSLAGKVPFDLEALEGIKHRHQDDLFSGEACQDFFDVLKESYDSNYAKVYYEHLCQSLRKIGLGIVAQRGSRVAHEQGPLLINSGVIRNTSKNQQTCVEVLEAFKNSKVEIKQALTKYIDISQYEKLFQAVFIDQQIALDDLAYLSTNREFAKAKLTKVFLQFKKLVKDFTDKLKTYLDKLSLDREAFIEVLDSVNQFETNTTLALFELNEIIKGNVQINKKSVIYVQRNSSRSGHIIARVLLGENLYVETDYESKRNRVLALPYTFVVQDFNLVAAYADSFFENASISIVTDPLTGVPDIKWQNARDLAINLAPGLFKAIEKANLNGTNFHYQLETTLFGSLIDDFRLLLETEISNYATVSKFKAGELDEYLEEVEQLIIQAADFIFEIYLIQEELNEIVSREKITKVEAVRELALSMRDVCYDLAAYTALLMRDQQSEYKYAKGNYETTILEDFKQQVNEIQANDQLAKKAKIKIISEKLAALIDDEIAEEYIEKYIRYPHSTAIKEIITDNYENDFVRVTSYKDEFADLYFDFSVAPSRIDFGDNVVASVTSLMGRIYGADDLESLAKAKSYVDLVSQADDSIFSSSSEAGSAKVIENTCRAIQYSKAIAMQGVFQSFDIDGELVRDTINTRDNAKVGLHVMEHGTMASTGYCITKEPLFILHALKELMEINQDKFDVDSAVFNEYSAFATQLIKFARMLNETGIIQRVQIMNDAIKQANKRNNTEKYYDKLKILLNASYKGNVSDERENANQYIIAFLLGKKKFIKNVGEPEVKKFFEVQQENYNLPLELRIYDPFVDPDVFMSGELKSIAEQTMNKIKLLSQKFARPLNDDQIKASLISYGSDFENWPLLNKRLEELDNIIEADKLAAEFLNLKADLKYLEIYEKGFYKDYKLAFQGIDIVQLNSDHSELISLMDNLPLVKNLMQINNPDSLLILVDNPQQAKKPFLDYERTLEWLALGGTVCSHMIAAKKYQEWEAQVRREKDWAKLAIKMMVSQELERDEQEFYNEYLKSAKKNANLHRDIILQKYNSAKDTFASHKYLMRYQKLIKHYASLRNLDLDYLTFDTWLLLGGRWVLNGQKQANIDYVLRMFGKYDKELLRTFVTNGNLNISLSSISRAIKQSGSTKEADLLVSDASESIDLREKQTSESQAYNLRKLSIEFWSKEITNLINTENVENLLNMYQKVCDEQFNARESEKNDQIHLLGKLLVVLENYAEHFKKYSLEFYQDIHKLINCKTEIDIHAHLKLIFGDHQSNHGSFERLASAYKSAEQNLDDLSILVEMVYISYLHLLTINIDEPNAYINVLAKFFDAYINVHEEDFPPYAFHRLCAGNSYGFSNDYYTDPQLRIAMFEYASASARNLYRALKYLVSEKTILAVSSLEYKNLLIGDFNENKVPYCYEHAIICPEERFWDCMRALRNFVRNYHDKHPLPVIVKETSTDELFGQEIDEAVDLVFIAGLSNPGKHSWDLPLVFKSPILREEVLIDQSRNQFVAIATFTPYLTEDGCMSDLYTSINPEVLETLEYVAPYADSKYDLNDYDFVHIVARLSKKAQIKPNLTMSAHTHAQYQAGLTKKIAVPEVWSELSMRQMYSKVELNRILRCAAIKGLAQINFAQTDYTTKDELLSAIKDKTENGKFDHIEYWILKASRDSGGRNISDKLSLHKDIDKIVDFIYLKLQTDDVVMQEFVPNNARAFIQNDFYKLIIDSFAEDGVAIKAETPYPNLNFAMRSFQSLSGIKGQLFSVSAASVTVNAGQGAKLFYGNPKFIMPKFLAPRIQKLFEDYGDRILKKAIPEHSLDFAKRHKLKLIDLPGGFSNCYMLNGLFDYIPYYYIKAEVPESGDIRSFKVFAEENIYGGLDFFYNYFGRKVVLASANNQADALKAIERKYAQIQAAENTGIEIDCGVDLAVIELNSGLGQANLLQKAIDFANEYFSDNTLDENMFIDWIKDLSYVARKSQLANLEHQENLANAAASDKTK
jgi:hypothetical protein